MHPIVPYARTAYAQGFAASAGPITPRVRAGCVAAIELAVANADDPQVLEATLHLGHLEGTWAAVYQRREQVHAGNERALLAAWRALGLAADAAQLVAAARQQAGLANERVRDSLTEWIASLIRRLFSTRISTGTLHRLSEAVRTAINKARAEGRAGALALAANDHTIVGFSFDLAFEDAYRALEHAASLVGAAEVDAWLNTLLGDAADDVGVRLAALTRDGAGYDDMVTAVRNLLDGTDNRALTSAIDLLTSRALSAGALDLYRSEGVTSVDFLTAGDARVCAAPCGQAEQHNPYPVADAPVPGLHPRCRCTLAPSQHASTLPIDLVTRYLDTADQGDQP